MRKTILITGTSNGFGNDAANTALKPVQSQLIAGIGFDALETLKVN